MGAKKMSRAFAVTWEPLAPRSRPCPWQCFAHVTREVEYEFFER